jgi:hypothetical protein
MNESHLRAQDIAFEAEILEHSGDLERARSKYAEAGSLEVIALRALNPSNLTTYGAIGVSAISLLYKGRRHGEAERVGHHCMLLKLDNYFKTEIRQLLNLIYDEQQLLERGFEYSAAETEVSLLGGEIGYGTAPIDVVLAKVTGFNLLCRRVAEWSASLPFRRSGPPSAELSRLLNLRVTQPVAGSYKFMVKFAQPVEQRLFEAEHSLVPNRLPQMVGALVRSAATGNVEAFTDMHDDYRGAVLQLVRNIVPDGKDVEEVRLSSLDLNRHANIDAVAILPSAKASVNSVIKNFRPMAYAPAQVIEGVLRAVHLDQNWLEVDVGDGKLVHISTKDDVLDDVVGPMINKMVAIHCNPSNRRPRMLDIELT